MIDWRLYRAGALVGTENGSNLGTGKVQSGVGCPAGGGAAITVIEGRSVRARTVVGSGDRVEC